MVRYSATDDRKELDIIHKSATGDIIFWDKTGILGGSS